MGTLIQVNTKINAIQNAKINATAGAKTDAKTERVIGNKASMRAFGKRRASAFRMGILGVLLLQVWPASAADEEPGIAYCQNSYRSCWLVTEERAKEFRLESFYVNIFPQSVVEFNDQSQVRLHDGHLYLQKAQVAFSALNFSGKTNGREILLLEGNREFNKIHNLSSSPFPIELRDGRKFQVPPWMSLRVGPIQEDRRNFIDLPQVLESAEVIALLNKGLDLRTAKAMELLITENVSVERGAEFNRRVASQIISDRDRAEKEKQAAEQAKIERQKQIRRQYHRKVFGK